MAIPDDRTLVAGVDSSTQSCKVVVVDAATGEVVREGRAVHPTGTEVDPEAWWDALGAALEDAGGLDDVAAISIAGQQHGMVVLDSAGRVIRDALLWNDTRSAAAARDLVAEIGADEYARRTGLVPVASFTATKLRWLRDAEPANAERVAAVALPHDWLSWRLRGYGPAEDSPRGPDLEALATDPSDASGTGYWDPSSRTYDGDLFAAALGKPMRVAAGSRAGGDGEAGERRGGRGDTSVVVPRVVTPGEAMATLESSVTLPRASHAPAGLLVAGGAGDNAAAGLGLGAVVGDVVVSLGTSGTVFGISENEIVDATGTIAGFADASGARLPIATTLNAARVLDLVADLLEVDHAGLSDLALAAPAGSDGVVLVPYFAGERTPNLPDATASFSGLTGTNTRRANIARAAVEGMLASLADGVDALESVSGTVPERILLIGGAARNPAVQAVARTLFAVPVEVPAPGEYVALGAAVQAAWALNGGRPEWKHSDVVRLEPDVVPAVRRAYRAAADKEL